MNPGRMDRKITIQETTDSRDTGGGVINSWADFWVSWAQRQDSPGTESVNGDRRESENTVVWTIRYYYGITTKMRVVDEDDNIYNILGISEVGRRNLMKLTTKINK